MTWIAARRFHVSHGGAIPMERKMGIVIQGPWPLRTQRPQAGKIQQLIEHELILLKNFEERRKTFDRQSRRLNERDR